MPDDSLRYDFVHFIEDLVDEHGPDSQSAVGWFRGDAETRYRVMLELVRSAEEPVTLLDFGCGLAGLYEYIQRDGVSGIHYEGLDLSDRLLSLDRERHPDVKFWKLDVLDPTAPALPEFDYIVMNGIFTYRGSHTPGEMTEYLQNLVPRVFASARVGLAFNLITPQVDWERDDLFHMSVDELLTFLSREVSRHVVIRHDYGLYEYTAYVYRDPSDPAQRSAKRLVEAPDQSAPPARPLTR